MSLVHNVGQLFLHLNKVAVYRYDDSLYTCKKTHSLI